ncbi:MAG: di-trans,poly-cis-decaprenylcistransferase [Sphaerochaetaceae bacterium]|nr:di-trans,poly-cis-decaprenylcistransferase [Sphaerochaetaceae bacterium]
MHIGLIMDGNGRWAQKRSLPRAAGHLEGLKACKRVVKHAADIGVDFLTLYVFSTENWKRPDQEVGYLMNLLAKKLPGEMDFYLENNIKIRVRGNIQALPEEARKGINTTIDKTASCTGLTVVLCINYGGQDEIARAATRFCLANPGKEITVNDINMNLDNPDIPAPDMIARSAGEHRISNFMLWDSAYAEFLSIDTLWPDWNTGELDYIISELGKRTRKFGGLSDVQK